MTDHPTKNNESDLRDTLDNTVTAASEFAHRQVERAADQATDQAEMEVTRAVDAAVAASKEFEPGSLQAQAAGQIAAQLQTVASSISDTDLAAATAKAKTFARENPALFLGGAALLGFAAARFLKASDPEGRGALLGDTDPWTGHVTGSPRTNPAHEAGLSNGSASS